MAEFDILIIIASDKSIFLSTMQFCLFIKSDYNDVDNIVAMEYKSYRWW